MDVIEQWVWFYYNQGFSVFPVKSTKPPSVDNKRPNITTWKKYITERPTEEEIKGWIKKKKFQNIGIVCGSVSNNLVVLDLDDKDIVPDLELNLDKLMNEKGVWVQVTGKEGRYHLICKNNDDPGGTVKDNLIHLEYRANGAYVVACPSIHPSGKVYHFLNYEEPDELPELKSFDVKSIYDDMVLKLRDKRGIEATLATQISNVQNIEADCIKNVFVGGLTEGRRNDTAFALANWYKHVKKLNPTEIRTLIHNWNKRNNPPLPSSELNTLITSAQRSDKSTGCKRLKELGFCPFDDIKRCNFLKPKRIEKGKDDKTKIEERPFIIEDGQLFEQVYDYTTFVPRYVFFDEGETKFIDSYQSNGIKYLPINDKKAIEIGAVFFPDKPEEYGTLQDLINEINEFIYKYVDISELFRLFATWYVLFSWIMSDRIFTVPYLRVIADFGCGKSRFLHTVGNLCYRPVKLAGSTSPASLFRSIERWKGTLILEEFTPHESGEEQDEIKILNCGFERNNPVIRCNTENGGVKLEYFDTFGPKLISSRKQFRDQALNSRCLTELLTETDRDDIPCDVNGTDFYEQQRRLRNKLLMFRLRHWDDFDPKNIQNIKFPKGISRRLKQAFSSFAVLFSNDEDALSIFMEYVQKYNNELIEERATSFDGRIVNAFFEWYSKGWDKITPKMISEKLEEVGVTGKNGSAVSPATIGRHLKNLGLPTKLVTVQGSTMRVVDGSKKVLNSLKNKYVVGDIEVEDEQQTILYGS